MKISWGINCLNFCPVFGKHEGPIIINALEPSIGFLENTVHCDVAHMSEALEIMKLGREKYTPFQLCTKIDVFLKGKLKFFL